MQPITPAATRAAPSTAALLDQVARGAPDNTALIYDGRRIDYAELRATSLQAARDLAALGVNKGTRVGVLLPNSPEWLAFAFGAWRLGAILVPLNTLMRERELADALRLGDVGVLVTAARFLRHDYLDILTRVCPELREPCPDGLFSTALPTLRRVVVVERGDRRPFPAGAAALARCREASKSVPAAVVEAMTPQVTPTDVGGIFFTSGSTAQPKGVVHTHASMLASAANVSDVLGLSSEDIVWGYLPFFFTGGLVAIGLATIAAAGSIALQEKFDAEESLRLLEATGCTAVFGWPHQMQAIVEHPSFERSRLRVHKGVGANAAWASRIYPPAHSAVSTYGMTESGPMCVATRFDDPLEQRSTTHGRALEGLELRICDPVSGAPLATPNQGEILLRGRTMMAGYYKMPRAASFDEDGFFHTGDRGWIDETGHLHFVGRIKDVIKTAGVNVACSEIESVLRSHPQVQDAHVVGVSHPTRGENPAAFVVASGDVTVDDLTSFCQTHLASYKVPRHIFFRRKEELPLAGSGKVLKARLREEAERLVDREQTDGSGGREGG